MNNRNKRPTTAERITLKALYHGMTTAPMILGGLATLCTAEHYFAELTTFSTTMLMIIPSLALVSVGAYFYHYFNN